MLQCEYLQHGRPKEQQHTRHQFMTQIYKYPLLVSYYLITRSPLNSYESIYNSKEHYMMELSTLTDYGISNTENIAYLCENLVTKEDIRVFMIVCYEESPVITVESQAIG